MPQCAKTPRADLVALPAEDSLGGSGGGFRGASEVLAAPRGTLSEHFRSRLLAEAGQFPLFWATLNAFGIKKGSRATPRGFPGRLSSNVGSICVSIFEVFRRHTPTYCAKGRTNVFADRRSTSEGSHTLQTTRESTKHRFASAFRITCAPDLRFFPSRARLGVNFGCIGPSPSVLGCLCQFSGVSPDCPWSLPRHSWGTLGTLRDAPKKPLVCLGCSGDAPRGPREQF